MEQAGSYPQEINRINLITINEKPVYTDLKEDVRKGLGCEQKTLPPKYFYDARGSELFDQICRTREYYPTRTEDQLLSQYADDILDQVRPHSIVELGSGASRKTHHFFNACERHKLSPVYQPVDICGEMLLQAGGRLCGSYPWLEVEAVVLDYTSDLHHLEDGDAHQLFVFLGGTLGNFSDAEALEFLADMRTIMQAGDRLLVGIDRAKDIDVLNAAYNDAEGITAEFNRNVLRVLNRELDANFNLHQFEHQAWFNSDESRIEMHLRSAAAQQVKVGRLDCEFGFEQDETILTEISRKFTPESFQKLLSVAGFAIESHFEPNNGYFSLFLLRPDKW